jgi:hypothetical protein
MTPPALAIADILSPDPVVAAPILRDFSQPWLSSAAMN